MKKSRSLRKRRKRGGAQEDGSEVALGEPGTAAEGGAGDAEDSAVSDVSSRAYEVSSRAVQKSRARLSHLTWADNLCFLENSKRRRVCIYYNLPK